MADKYQGFFTNALRALKKKSRKIYNTRNHINGENFKLYQVSAWNSHGKYDFSITQISREYLGEVVKR